MWRMPNSVPLEDRFGAVIAPVRAAAAPLLLLMRATVA